MEINIPTKNSTIMSVWCTRTHESFLSAPTYVHMCLYVNWLIFRPYMRTSICTHVASDVYQVASTSCFTTKWLFTHSRRCAEKQWDDSFDEAPDCGLHNKDYGAADDDVGGGGGSLAVVAAFGDIDGYGDAGDNVCAKFATGTWDSCHELNERKFVSDVVLASKYLCSNLRLNCSRKTLFTQIHWRVEALMPRRAQWAANVCKYELKCS